MYRVIWEELQADGWTLHRHAEFNLSADQARAVYLEKASNPDNWLVLIQQEDESNEPLVIIPATDPRHPKYGDKPHEDN